MACLVRAPVARRPELSFQQVSRQQLPFTTAPGALTLSTLSTPRATTLCAQPCPPPIHIIKKKNKTIYKKIKIAGTFQLPSDFVLTVQGTAHDSRSVVTMVQRATAPQSLKVERVQLCRVNSTG